MLTAEGVVAITNLAPSVETYVLDNGEQVVAIPQGGGKFDVRSARSYTLSLFEAPVMALSTLGGLVDYLRENRDGWKLETLSAVVASPTTVRVFAAVAGPRLERHQIAEVTSLGGSPPKVLSGEFYTHEDAIIGLQWGCKDTGDRAAVLRMLGFLTSGASRTVSDDGITQEVNTKVGVSMKANATVPNPVLLAPFRTFREVEQPLSPFVVRVQGGDETKVPRVAFFLADGGEWQLTAIDTVARWLRVNLPAVVSVIA